MKKLILNVKTSKKDQIVDITSKLSNLVKDLEDQMIVVSVPHTTAAITINENYDSDVKTDIIYSLNKISPDYSE